MSSFNAGSATIDIHVLDASLNASLKRVEKAVEDTAARANTSASGITIGDIEGGEKILSLSRDLSAAIDAVASETAAVTTQTSAAVSKAQELLTEWEAVGGETREIAAALEQVARAANFDNLSFESATSSGREFDAILRDIQNRLELVGKSGEEAERVRVAQGAKADLQRIADVEARAIASQQRILTEQLAAIEKARAAQLKPVVRADGVTVSAPTLNQASIQKVDEALNAERAAAQQRFEERRAEIAMQAAQARVGTAQLEAATLKDLEAKAAQERVRIAEKEAADKKAANDKSLNKDGGFDPRAAIRMIALAGKIRIGIDAINISADLMSGKIEEARQGLFRLPFGLGSVAQGIDQILGRLTGIAPEIDKINSRIERMNALIDMRRDAFKRRTDNALAFAAAIQRVNEELAVRTAPEGQQESVRAGQSAVAQRSVIDEMAASRIQKEMDEIGKIAKGYAPAIAAANEEARKAAEAVRFFDHDPQKKAVLQKEADEARQVVAALNGQMLADQSVHESTIESIRRDAAAVRLRIYREAEENIIDIAQKAAAQRETAEAAAALRSATELADIAEQKSQAMLAAEGKEYAARLSAHAHHWDQRVEKANQAADAERKALEKLQEEKNVTRVKMIDVETQTRDTTAARDRLMSNPTGNAQAIEDAENRLAELKLEHVRLVALADEQAAQEKDHAKRAAIASTLRAELDATREATRAAIEADEKRRLARDLASAESELAQLNFRINGDELAAQLRGITDAYEQQIQAAITAGNTELAATLEQIRDAKIADAQNRTRDRQEAEERQVQSSIGQLKLRLDGKDLEAQLKAIEDSFAEKIKQAMKDGNDNLAALLMQERDLQLQEAQSKPDATGSTTVGLAEEFKRIQAAAMNTDTDKKQVAVMERAAALADKQLAETRQGNKQLASLMRDLIEQGSRRSGPFGG